MYPGEPGRYARGRMDAGEQTTGTRDEHYNLISVLYHALHGADNCDVYVADAEAAGRDDLAAFFRQAQEAQVVIAERAKMMLGILEVPPEPEVAPDAPPEGGVPPGTAEIETTIPPGAPPRETPGDVVRGTSPDTPIAPPEEIVPPDTLTPPSEARPEGIVKPHGSGT